MLTPDFNSKARQACPDETTSHSTRLSKDNSQVAGYELSRRCGYIHVATDWQDYAGQVLAVLSAEPLLENTAAGYAPRPDYRPLTKFEQRGLRLGHGVWDLVFLRRG